MGRGLVAGAVDELPSVTETSVPNQSSGSSVNPLNRVASHLVRIKTFGPFGPPYEVGKPTRQLDDGDWLAPVTMVETGELAEYRMSRTVGDPDAA